MAKPIQYCKVKQSKNKKNKIKYKTSGWPDLVIQKGICFKIRIEYGGSEFHSVVTMA